MGSFFKMKGSYGNTLLFGSALRLVICLEHFYMEPCIIGKISTVKFCTEPLNATSFFCFAKEHDNQWLFNHSVGVT